MHVIHGGSLEPNSFASPAASWASSLSQANTAKIFSPPCVHTESEESGSHMKNVYSQFVCTSGWFGAEAWASSAASVSWTGAHFPSMQRVWRDGTKKKYPESTPPGTECCAAARLMTRIWSTGSVFQTNNSWKPSKAFSQNHYVGVVTDSSCVETFKYIKKAPKFPSLLSRWWAEIVPVL